MRFIDTLLLAAGAGRGVYGRWRMQKIMPLIVTMAILVIAAAAMVTALTMGGIYVMYMLLLQQGVGLVPAMLITAGMALLLTLILILSVKRRILQLNGLVTTPISDAADAFLNGLLARP